MDTLAYAKRLRSAGVPEAQAEAHAEAMRDAVVEALATKADITEVKGDIAALSADVSGDIAAVKAEIAAVRAEITAVRQDLDTAIANLKAELMKWMFGIAGAQVVLIVTLMKLL